MPSADINPVSIVRRPLTEADAIDIWLARWLRVRRKDIIERYGCDPRRIYEIWNETRFPASRSKAIERARELYPSLLDRIDTGPHRTQSRAPYDPNQLGLFD